MTTDSDRDEIHATADPDSAVDADPSLTADETADERPAADEPSDSGESPSTPDGFFGNAVSPDSEERLGTEDDLSSSADSSDDADSDEGTVDESAVDESTDDDEEEDDGLIVIAKSDDVADPSAATGETGDVYDWDESDDENEEDDEEDDEVASAVVVTEVAADPYQQNALDQNEPVHEDDAGADDVTAAVAADAVAADDSAGDNAAADAAHQDDAAEAASVEQATPVPAPAPARTAAEDGDAGFGGDPEEIHRRWVAIQSSFVDDPHQSVADAAAFLEETTTALVASIKQRESDLRGAWDNQSLDTEGLRTMLRRYRAVLDRMAAL